MVKNLPSNTRGSGSIPGQGAKITCAVEQMSPHNSTREKPVCYNKEPTCHSKTQPSHKKEILKIKRPADHEMVLLTRKKTQLLSSRDFSWKKPCLGKRNTQWQAKWNYRVNMDVGVRSPGLESHLVPYKLCDSKEVTGHLWALIFFMWTEEPGGLQLMKSQSRTRLSD